MNHTKYIEDHTLRCEASYRGGGIEISLDDYLGGYGFAMTAYQNYLGGGMLGSIQNDYNFDLEALSPAKQRKVAKMADALNRYFHDLTNHEGDEWEETSYEAGQLRPSSYPGL